MAKGSLVADGVRLGPAARLASFERVSKRRHLEEKGGEEADDEDEDEEEEEDSDDDSEIEEARESKILVPGNPCGELSLTWSLFHSL